jgi:hypothetical protein
MFRSSQTLILVKLAALGFTVHFVLGKDLGHGLYLNQSWALLHLTQALILVLGLYPTQIIL